METTLDAIPTTIRLPAGLDGNFIMIFADLFDTWVFVCLGMGSPSS
jgi:hypothetical protein